MLMKYPAARAACSIANRVLAGPYSVVSKATTPSVLVRRVTSARADEFRRYPSCSIAASTRSRVAGLTLGWLFKTRETVWCETPADRATSAMMGLRRDPPGDDTASCTSAFR
jgi:hypothetical protein